MAVTVIKSNYVHKESKEQKLISVKMSLESEIRRCKAILSYIQDPIAKQGIELMIESLKKDFDLINDVERF